MLKILIGTDWKANTATIMEMVAEDIRQKKPNRILMVPELVSHTTERTLARVGGDSASLYAEVLSFTRLVRRVAEQEHFPLEECLDKGGRVVAMAAATRMLHSKLKAYASVETRPEFLTDMLDAVDEFKRCTITSDDLMAASKQTEGSLAQKLEELALIYETYNAICTRGKKDPRDQMTWLLEQLEAGSFAQKHTFYFDAFPDFSRQHMDIVHHLICNAPEVVISLNCDKPASDLLAYEKAGETANHLISFAKRMGIDYCIIPVEPGKERLLTVTDSLFQGHIQKGQSSDFLHVYTAESIFAECEAVTEKILELAKNGVRYRDIGIVCCNLAAYKNPIHTVLGRGGIPLYLSGTENVLGKNVIYAILQSIEVALDGFYQKDVFRYMKSVLSPISIEQSDIVEQYAVLWSISGNKWTSKWANHPRGLEDDWSRHDEKRLEELNTAREKLITPLERLRDGFRDAIAVKQQVLALYAFFDEIQLYSKIKALAEQMEQTGAFRNAQILNQLWDILINALEQLYDVLGDTSWSSETFVKLLRLLLGQYDVGTIPTVLDAVTVGTVSTMRCHRMKHLFILGASEGAFPAYGNSAGVLNDFERSALQKIGIPINPGAVEGLQTQFLEIQQVFTATSEQVYVYCSNGQPSFVFKRLGEMTGKIDSVSPQFGAALTDRWEAAACLVREEQTEWASKLHIAEEFDTITHCREYQLGTVSKENARKLYGETMRMSASRVDVMAKCKLFYFFQYGLNAKESKPITLDASEFGTYVHAVLEECGRAVTEKGGFQCVSYDEVLRIAKEVSDSYYEDRFSKLQSERLYYQFKSNWQEVQLIVKELWEEMQECDFQPHLFELHFDEGQKMPAISIKGQEVSATLNGFVDRVDLWERDGKPYVRVVDYKTGTKLFDYVDILNGIGLQMLLYLYAIEDGGVELFGEKPKVSGIQYFPAKVPFVSMKADVPAEEAERAHKSDFRRNGLLLNDDVVLYAMEHSDDPQRISCKKDKDGNYVGNLASADQFEMLKQYIYQFLAKTFDEVATGNVEAYPYKKGQESPCFYCPYGMICRPERLTQVHEVYKVDSNEFWEQVEKEVADRG